MLEIKPCPFCNRTALPVERHNPMSKWRWSVDCQSSTCGMSGPVEASKADAIAAWNNRTPPERARVLEEALRPMSSAPRDRTFILARYRVPDDHTQARFNGRWFSIFHEGVTPSGFDLGWTLYPGYGGVPDDHFDGWMPCPDAALSASPPEVVEQ